MNGTGVHNVKIPRNQLKNMLKKKTKQDRFRNGKKDISPVSKVLGTLRPLPGGVEIPAWWWWLTLALDAKHSPGNLFRACTLFLEELVLGFLLRYLGPCYFPECTTLHSPLLKVSSVREFTRLVPSSGVRVHLL